jgi:LysR family glycine cleavage system transcriptional activator
MIHGTVSAVQWTDWLVRHGVAQGPWGLALHFDRAQFVLDAALQGLGVALECATSRWAI